MPPPPGAVSGVVFKVFAADGTTKVYINVCGHPSIGLPLTKSMDPVPSTEFLDLHGLDNLIVPICVNDPVHCKRTSAVDANRMVIVDVVLNPEIVKRLKAPEHRLYQDFISRVSALAMEWVTQETGIQLSQRTVKLLPSVSYKEPVETKKSEAADQDSITPQQKKEIEESVRRRANELYEQLLRETGGSAASGSGSHPPSASAPPSAPPTSSDGVQLPSSFVVSPATATKETTAAPKRPMVVEMSVSEPQRPLIKKGFLNTTKARLYDDKGSTEGILPEGAGDPLGYIPKGLREKCKIIDTRQPAQEEKPSKKSLPFTVGSADEVSGEEFLQQLATIDKVISGSDPNALASFTDTLQKEMKAGGEFDAVRDASTAAAFAASMGVLQPPEAKGTSPPLQDNAVAGEHVKPQPQQWEPTVSVEEPSSDGRSKVTIRIKVPDHVAGMKDLDLNVESEFVEVNGVLRVRPPCLLDVDSVAAKFVKNSRTLVLTGLSAA